MHFEKKVTCFSFLLHFWYSGGGGTASGEKDRTLNVSTHTGKRICQGPWMKIFSKTKAKLRCNWTGSEVMSHETPFLLNV